MTRFRLEGKLKGDWVRELERCWSTARSLNLQSETQPRSVHKSPICKNKHALTAFEYCSASDLDLMGEGGT